MSPGLKLSLWTYRELNPKLYNANVPVCRLPISPIRIKWTLPGSNRSPLPCHGSALPNELRALATLGLNGENFIYKSMQKHRNRIEFSSSLAKLLCNFDKGI